MAVIQLAGVPRGLAVDQAVRPAGVEPHNPVPNRLQPDAADPRRPGPGAAIVDLGHAAPHGWLRHPLSGRDPQEGDDDDTDDSFWSGRFRPGWADVAPTQARCGPAPAAG